MMAAAVSLGWDGAGSEVETGYDHHVTVGELVVGSPYVQAHAALPEGLCVDAEYRADVISAASVDLITQATASYEETRHQAGAGLAWEETGDRAALRYFFSTEPDYLSHALQAEAATEVVERTWRLQGSYSLRLDEQGRAGDGPEAFEDVRDHVVGVSVSHALTPTTELSAVLEGHWQHGALESPYRMVPIFRPRAKVRTDAWGWVAENHPGERLRLAGALQVRQALSERVFVTLLHRQYADDWGVYGATTAGSLVLPLGASVWLDVGARHHWQDEAGFFRTRYDCVEGCEDRAPRYVTRDRKLGELWTGRGSLAVRWQVGPLGPVGTLRASAYADGLVIRYAGFEWLDREHRLRPYEGSTGISGGLSVLGRLR